jgi:hypothetical protein
VVWGLLNQSDTAHYIRVEKAFLDPTTSALDIARIPDSLYYDNAIVQLRRISTNQVFTLNRVDGNLEGYPRDTGVFAWIPNYLYKIKASQINLVAGDEYELIIDRGDGKVPVTATTVILPKPDLRNPAPGAKLSLKPKSGFTFTWSEQEDAVIFDLKLIFHYSERSPETNNIFVDKSFEWDIVNNLEDKTYSVEGTDFFNIIKANIEDNPQAIRRFNSIDIVLWSGGQEIRDFIRIAQANDGITSTQEIPKYTNLSEGIGIFSSRNVSYITGFDLTDQAIDSLMESNITAHLNFQ